MDRYNNSCVGNPSYTPGYGQRFSVNHVLRARAAEQFILLGIRESKLDAIVRIATEHAMIEQSTF
jgi:hypothetical protein